MGALLAWFKLNWKSNLIATAAIIYSAQAFVTAIGQWQNGQPANWRAAAVSLFVAGLGYVTKDNSNHSTLAQVEAQQAKVEGKPQAPVMIKAANDQVVGK